MFAASTVVATFHINLRLSANTYQRKSRRSLGILKQRNVFFPGNMGMLGRKYFQIFNLQSVKLVFDNVYETKYCNNCATFKLALIQKEIVVYS